MWLIVLALLAVVVELALPARALPPDMTLAPVPWALVAMGAGALYNHFKGKKDQKKVDQAQQPLQAATAAEGVRAAGLEQQQISSRQDYLTRLNAFNPQAYASQAAGADAANIFEQFQYDESGRKTNLQQRGFGSGSPLGSFRNRESFNVRLANALAGRSMEAAGMEHSRIRDYGDLNRFDAGRADLSRERELDLMVGNRDFAQGQANAGSTRRNQLLGLLAQGVGAYYGSRG